MARPTKQGIDYFPLWKPQRTIELKFSFSDFRIRFKAIRNSSSAFIKKENVRRIVFKEDGFKCVFCGSNKDITIDHIVSVYRVARGNYPIEKLNVRDNLQTLCSLCNAGKSP